MACPARLYPLKQPHNYTPPVPRWTLQLPSDVTHIHTLYIGIQRHSSTPASLDAYTAASHSISIYLQRPPAALATDTLAVTSGFDTPGTRVWVAYWPTSTPPPPPDLLSIYHSLSSSAIGLWTESFTVPTTRLECNYSALAHTPGLAALPGASFPAHSLSAYWGAARDRIPDSGWDLYPAASEARTQPPSSPPVGLGERLTGSSYDNMVHIRSGQWWADCDDVEREAYEGPGKLQETLMGGMAYLWEHARETGTLGLRFLFNVDPGSDEENLNLRRESCGAGFFRNLEDLEKWSSRHPSHLKIFNGAHKHARDFGEGKRFMTWHEVSVLKEGEGRFEYVNCVPETGVVRWVGLAREVLEMDGEADGQRVR